MFPKIGIHGGFTFCECFNNDEKVNKKHIDRTIKRLKAIKEKTQDSKGYMDKFKKQQKVSLKANNELAKLDNSYVVFGFDCAHLGDDTNSSLRDPKYIMLLTEKMERQLIDYAKIYEKWKKMDRKQQIKAIEYITGERSMKELGFGAMIDMLAGGTSFKGGK